MYVDLTVYLINDLSVTNDLFYISTLIVCCWLNCMFSPFFFKGWCCTVWSSSRLKEMAIVRFVYRSPPVVWWHLTVFNYWFIFYGLLNSFEHCQINFTALLNITDLFGSKWWSRLVLWKGLVAFQPHLNFSMHMDFMGKSLHIHLLTVVLHYV